MTFWIIVMGFFTTAFLMLPFFRQPFSRSGGVEPSEEREALFAQLADLEYDYHMGKIVRRDYDEMRQHMYSQLSALSEGQEVDQQILRQRLYQEVERRLNEEARV